jgi:hypothetical protein
VAGLSANNPPYDSAAMPKPEQADVRSTAATHGITAAIKAARHPSCESGTHGNWRKSIQGKSLVTCWAVKPSRVDANACASLLLLQCPEGSASLRINTCSYLLVLASGMRSGHAKVYNRLPCAQRSATNRKPFASMIKGLTVCKYCELRSPRSWAPIPSSMSL